jgi:hypothetical protein
MNYSSSAIQKRMLMKLTTENPSAKRSMLAASRSLSGDNFQLTVNDTILFHAMNVGLFDTYKSVEDTLDVWKNKIEAWKNIVYCQENQHASLCDPLQIALVCILSANNSRIDSRPAGDVYDYTKSVLLTNSSSNGLFPGQFNENQEPIPFDNESSRDSYWHVTFEVPYILWTYPKDRSTENYQLPGEHFTQQKLSELVYGMEMINGRMDLITASPATTALKVSK